MSSPHADGESYKNTQCGEKQASYVELTLAGNDIETQLDKSNVTSAKAKTIKNCIITKQDEQCLIVRRNLDSSKAIYFLRKN